jgi:hypothetical protein
MAGNKGVLIRPTFLFYSNPDGRVNLLAHLSSIKNLPPLHVNSEAVIPAEYRVRGKLQRESRSENTGLPRIKYGAG